jgi:hypothetical protein
MGAASGPPIGTALFWQTQLRFGLVQFKKSDVEVVSEQPGK